MRTLILLILVASAINTQAKATPSKSGVSSKMVIASLVARQSSLPRSTGYCWRYVKRALLASGAVSSYPSTNYAFEAGHELVAHHGFTKLRVSSPWSAPIGSVLVYGPNRRSRAGHVEIRGSNDFISDYRGRRPASFKFLGAYALVNS